MLASWLWGWRRVFPSLEREHPQVLTAFLHGNRQADRCFLGADRRQNEPECTRASMKKRFLLLAKPKYWGGLPRAVSWRILRPVLTFAISLLANKFSKEVIHLLLLKP